ncbi:hypothetical protein ACFLQY_00515 [Verrucomicrobiota bacterium]
MGVEVNYSVRKRGQQCEACAREFEDGEKIHSRLIFENGEYMRLDYCKACKSQQNVDTTLSSWTTVYIPPPSPKEEALKKENAESLLRKLIDDNTRDHTNAIYILAIMLERKKLVIERDVQTKENGKKLRIYEHKKTGETFLITDPDLKLNELEHVQEEVVNLLGGPQKLKKNHQ